MDSGMKLGKNRLRLKRVFGDDGVVAEFADVVIEASSTRAHKERKSCFQDERGNS
jgi:hypothetical protein